MVLTEHHIGGTAVNINKKDDDLFVASEKRKSHQFLMLLSRSLPLPSLSAQNIILL